MDCPISLFCWWRRIETTTVSGELSLAMTISSRSMDAQQASELAISLHQMGEDELACEIDEAVGRATHYEAM
jgi:hypothetical protein